MSKNKGKEKQKTRIRINLLEWHPYLLDYFRHLEGSFVFVGVFRGADPVVSHLAELAVDFPEHASFFSISKPRQG